jgi:hypothetical protein
MCRLDFDGCVITNSGWNTAALPTITIPAYDTDNNPATFSRYTLRTVDVPAVITCQSTCICTQPWPGYVASALRITKHHRAAVCSLMCMQRSST